MTRKILIAAFALGSLLLAAQTPPPAPPPGEIPDAEAVSPKDGPARRELLRLAVISQMRQRMGLSEAQTVRVMTIFEAMEKQQERHRLEMEPIQKRLRAIVEDPATPDPAFKEAVAAFEKQREANQRENDAREAELLAALNPRQQAQWVLLRRELIGRIADRMEGRRGPGQRPPAE